MSTKQRNLFDDDDDQYVKAFREFHRQNPHVFDLFERFTLNAIKTGRRKKFGAWLVYGRMRWYWFFETTDPVYKLNNNHIAFYSRMFMRSHPEHAGIFETRKSKADEVDMMEFLKAETPPG